MVLLGTKLKFHDELLHLGQSDTLKVVQVETEKNLFLHLMDQSYILTSPLPYFLLQVTLAFSIPFSVVWCSFLVLNSVKTTARFLHPLSAALPFSLGCCLHDPLYMREFDAVSTVSKCFWALVLSCKSWPKPITLLFILRDKWHTSSFLGCKCGCSIAPNSKCSYHVYLWNVNSFASAGWMCCQTQYG